MKYSARLMVLIFVGGAAAVFSELTNRGGRSTAIVLITLGVALGELMVLRPPHRTPIPLSYAFMLVLVRGADPWVCIGAIALAELAVLPLRDGDWAARLAQSGQHLVAGIAALTAYEALMAVDQLGPTPRLLTALAAAGVAALVVHEAAAAFTDPRWPEVGGADLALVASGMLMAIGFRGVEPGESVGLWSVGLFSIPLLAAWYSFERLALISRTSEQTIEALSVVPELAGLAPAGHAARVAELSVRVGDQMGLRRRELEDLRAAALLHHLGHLCLDAPEARERPIEPSEVSDQGAEILRQTDLAAAGDLLATDDARVGSQILRAVSAFDDLVSRDMEASEAMDALYSGPGFVYDSRVIDALDRIVASAPSV
ncbi:MAG: hypothetical protein JJE46_06810 [Acidimicrobiia bacterium]|nr:hypothetical protein [Acidimicrobiia bacterium]